MNAPMTMNNEQNTAKFKFEEPTENEKKVVTPAHYEELEELKLESVAGGGGKKKGKWGGVKVWYLDEK